MSAARSPRKKLNFPKLKLILLPHAQDDENQKMARSESSHHREALAWLVADPPRISQTWLYDAEGSRLYDLIVDLDEYYLPEAEMGLLKEHGSDIVGHQVEPHQHVALIELGAGCGLKTHGLLDELSQVASLTTYVPTDISEAALETNREHFEKRFSSAATAACAGAGASSAGSGAAGAAAGHKPINLCPIAGTHEEALAKTEEINADVRVFMFMGSSLGNYDDGEILDLFGAIARRMRPAGRDRFVLAVDRAHGPSKSVARIVAAYNDAKGVTAAFTLNALAHVNRVLGLDFDVTAWKHCAEYDEATCRIVTHVEALESQDLHQTTLKGQGRHQEKGASADAAQGPGGERALVRAFAAGDRIFMEQSRKFDPASVAALAARAGLATRREWGTDDYVIFELVLSAEEKRGKAQGE